MPTIVLQPSEAQAKDVYVSKSYPNANYNTSDHLDVYTSDAGEDINIAYLQFDLSSLPFGAASVINAYIELEIKNVSQSTDSYIEAYIVDKSWDEATVTYTTQPTLGVRVFRELMYSTANVKHQINVTNSIDQVFLRNYGWAIKSKSASIFYYSSNSTIQPKLVIEYDETPSKPVIIQPNGGETLNEVFEIKYEKAYDQRIIYTYVIDRTDLLPVYQLDTGSIGQTFKAVDASESDFKVRNVSFYVKDGSGDIDVSVYETDGTLPTNLLKTVRHAVTANQINKVNLDLAGLDPSKTYAITVSYVNAYVEISLTGGTAQNDRYPYGSAVKYTAGAWSTISGEDTYMIIETGVPDGLQYQIQLSIDNGSTWRDIVSATPLSSYSYDFVREQETSLGRLRVRATDGKSYGQWDESDGVFTILHNKPPSTPTNLVPNGGAINRQLVQRFTWKHNDEGTQSRAVIEWKLQSETTWNTVEVNSPNQYYDFGPNALPAGTIVWRVQTFDDYEEGSPWSNTAIFTSAEPADAPIITGPISPVITAIPTIQWSSLNQVAYELVIQNSLGAVIWETGEVPSVNRSRTVGVTLENSANFKALLRVKDSNGIFSAWASKDFYTSYVPPAKPSVTAQPTSGQIILDILNPQPEGDQPAVSGNDILKLINGEWVRIAEGVGTQYRDFNVESGGIYQYKVRAIGDNGTSIESEQTQEVTTTFQGVWLHDVTDPDYTYYQFKYDGGGRSSQWEIESSVMRFKGRNYPVIETGEMQDDVVNFQLALTTAEEIEALKKLVYARNILCYRDGRGRMLFGIITRLPLNDETWRGQTTSLEIMRIDFKEGV